MRLALQHLDRDPYTTNKNLCDPLCALCASVVIRSSRNTQRRAFCHHVRFQFRRNTFGMEYLVG